MDEINNTEEVKEVAENKQEATYLAAKGKVYDHTDSYNAEDISENRLYCIAVYVFGIIGVIVASLLAKDSPYARFHIRQMLKISIVETIVIFVMSVLCWTVIVPIASMVCLLALFIIRIACILDVTKNKAVDALIIKDIGFLA